MDDARIIELGSRLFEKTELLRDGDKTSPTMKMLREDILDLAVEIQSLTTEPLEVLRTHTTGAHQVVLHFINRFGLANLVPVDKGVSYREVAAQCGQKDSTVQRMLRHAIGLGIFRDEVPSALEQVSDQGGLVSHTRVSMLLRDPSIAAWINATCEETWPASSRTVDALSSFPAATEPSECGWALAHARDGQRRRSIYDVLAEDKLRATRFATGMMAHSAGPAFSPSHIISSRREILGGLADGSKFVDVGGGMGNFSIALSQAFPHLDFVVQDLPNVIQDAQAQHHEVGDPSAPKLSGITFQSHNFFRPQPVLGAAVYFLRYILHNWSDKYSLEILRHIGNAMQSRSSRLIILDYCMEDLAQLSLRMRRTTTAMDIGMISQLNGQERNAAQWKALLVTANPRFEWIGITKPPGSALTIIEAFYKGTEE